MTRLGEFLGTLVLCVCCTATVRGEPPYVSVKVKDVTAPALPRACGKQASSGSHILIFSSKYCPACGIYLRQLAGFKKELVQRKVSVLVCVVDDVNCAQATRDSFKHGAWPVCIANDEIKKAWGGVTVQPTIFLVANNHIGRVIKGRPPIQSLLAELDDVLATTGTTQAVDERRERMGPSAR